MIHLVYLEKKNQNSFRNFWTVGWIFSQFKKIHIILILFWRINDIYVSRRYETFFAEQWHYLTLFDPIFIYPKRQSIIVAPLRLLPNGWLRAFYFFAAKQHEKAQRFFLWKI